MKKIAVILIFLSMTLVAMPLTTLAADTFTTPLFLGSKGPMVKVLLQTLASQKYYSGPISQTYGPKTKVAVRAFQKTNGIPPTGTVGPITRATLNALLADMAANKNTGGVVKVGYALTGGNTITKDPAGTNSSATTKNSSGTNNSTNSNNSATTGSTVTNNSTNSPQQSTQQAGNPQTETPPATPTGTGILPRIEINNSLSTLSAITIPNYVGGYNSYLQNPSVAAKIVFRAYDDSNARIKNGSVSYDADAYNESHTISGQNYCPNNSSLEPNAKNLDECYYMLYYRPGVPGNNGLVLHLTSLLATIAKSVQVTGIQQNLEPPQVQSNTGNSECNQSQSNGNYVFDGCLGITATSSTIRYYLRTIDYSIISSNITPNDISFSLISGTQAISLINEGTRLGLTSTIYVDSQNQLNLNATIALASNKSGTFQVKITGTGWATSEDSTPTVSVPLNITTEVISTTMNNN